MPTRAQLVQAAWDAPRLRRAARALADLALAELTLDTARKVRPPDFHRRGRALLRTRPTLAAVPAWLREVAASGLRLNHPCYMAQQVGAPLPLAALMEPVTAALNQSIAVWDMSPVGTLVDRALMDRFKRLFDYPATAEGSFTPGGSFANLTALLAARAALAPGAWRKGGARIALLAGAQTHYSVARAAGIMGLGSESVFAIPTNAQQQSDTGAIAATARAARARGYRQFILVATSGSTPTGSFDDLEAFAREARRLRGWLHVDAAHGGGMAFSARGRRLLRGLDRADSVAFDPHKMMFMPLAAGAVLVRRGGQLRGAFEQHAPYLFSPVRNAVGDVGAFTLACSQRFEALRIWLCWQVYGPALFAAMSEATCVAAQAAHAWCERSRVLEPLHTPESNIFCFRLRRPPRGGAAGDARHWAVKEAVNGSGRAYISSTVLDGRRCLRIVAMNPRTERRHVERVMRLIEREARRLEGTQ